ncbi:hypothetical protein M3J09_003707 [Ascochyta lentis]
MRCVMQSVGVRPILRVSFLYLRLLKSPSSSKQHYYTLCWICTSSSKTNIVLLWEREAFLVHAVVHQKPSDGCDTNCTSSGSV